MIIDVTGLISTIFITIFYLLPLFLVSIVVFYCFSVFNGFDWASDMIQSSLLAYCLWFLFKLFQWLPQSSQYTFTANPRPLSSNTIPLQVARLPYKNKIILLPPSPSLYHYCQRSSGELWVMLKMILLKNERGSIYLQALIAQTRVTP